MDDRRRKTILVIITLLFIRRSLLVFFMMGHYYYKHIMPSTRAYSRRRLRYNIVDKIPKQIEYLNRVIAADDVTCVERIRMSKDAFTKLCYLLKHVGGLVPTRSVGVEERVATFLVILAHHSKNRTVKFDFRRSGKTISRGFRCVLHALLKLHHLLLVTPTPVTENEMSEQWRPFKGCLGALDGTYIPVTVPLSDAPRYRNRKGFVSVNVLGVCDRDMRFVHMLSGWEGSASDARVLRDAVTKQSGLKVPQGNYYLVDGGYANSNGFLAPYRSIRYHLKEWESGHLAPQNYKEYFNMKHSKARNVVERAFGLLKKRWAILRSPSFYPIKTQNQIILACGLLHNFIRSNMAIDPIEEELEDEEEQEVGNERGPSDFIDNIASTTAWSGWRDDLANSIYGEWLGNRV